jgi:hypothetical protein
MLKRRASDDANAETEQDSTGEELMAAVMAMDVDVAKKLLLSGAPSSHQDEATGSSALMLAAGTGSLAMVSLLLSNGAPWNALDRRGKCAGEYAVEGNHQECVNALVSAGVAAELLFGAVDRSVKITSQETTVLEPVSSSVSPSSSSSSSSAPSSSSSAASPEGDYDAHFPAPPGQYLEDRGVRYDGDNLLDSADDAVMMAWEVRCRLEAVCLSRVLVVGERFCSAVIRHERSSSISKRQAHPYSPLFRFQFNFYCLICGIICDVPSSDRLTPPLMLFPPQSPPLPCRLL